MTPLAGTLCVNGNKIISHASTKRGQGTESFWTPGATVMDVLVALAKDDDYFAMMDDVVTVGRFQRLQARVADAASAAS